ncbi:hypothetical protein IAR55_006353 [Kwoniella newhampshirensis]|uniref:Zn(2)-C6 fungal-type domain-containing protein n=1 Tax=Kwoniella newhampshirensis TaxID=1651941 RepID=A0AAW0YV19_9TREE
MYTTACVACRKVRSKCIRASLGQNPDEACQRCLSNHIECVTLKRRVGRQAGVKNRKRKTDSVVVIDQIRRFPSLIRRVDSPLPRDVNHLPNPLHELASEAVRRHLSPDAEALPPSQDDPSHVQDNLYILDQYAEWTDKLDASAGREVLAKQLDAILMSEGEGNQRELDDSPVFCGRIDMARPDASPEHDVISLQMISISEAQHLFDSFMTLLTNGSMHMDHRLHTLPYVRARSSFLLAVILAMASTYIPLGSSSRLHSRLIAHVTKLESHVRNQHLKSIEIIQGLLILASWHEVPCSLCKDRTWLRVSYAIALTVELRLDSPLPYCIQTDPMYDVKTHDLLVRNAHRVCFLVYIHDRSMAMVSGRYPVFPESNLTSTASLNRWGKHPRAHPRFDAAICASVSLRKLVSEMQLKLGANKTFDLARDQELINLSMAEWRSRWANEIKITREYDIIAKFSEFVLTLTVMKKQTSTGYEVEARSACETIAFEVCCLAINHYKSWTGLLNSATFDTSMVAFCAIYIIQSINLACVDLSDWSLFRLAVIQELVVELEKQAANRHQVDAPDSMSAVGAVAQQLSRGIRLILIKKRNRTKAVDHSAMATERGLTDNGIEGDTTILGEREPSSLLGDLLIPQYDELSQFMSSNNAMPFVPEWNLQNALPEMNFPWDTNPEPDLRMFFDLHQ